MRSPLSICWVSAHVDRENQKVVFLCLMLCHIFCCDKRNAVNGFVWFSVTAGSNDEAANFGRRNVSMEKC